MSSTRTVGRRRGPFPVRMILIALVLAAAATVLGLSWSRLSAPGSSPDDDYHAISMLCPPPAALTGCQGILSRDKDGNVVQTGVLAPSQVVHVSCPHVKPISADCLLDHSPDVLEETQRVDLGEYPGPYYKIMSRVYAHHDVFSGFWRVRVANTVAAVAALGAVALAGTAATRRLEAYALAASMVPLGLFIVFSINPSSWSIVGLTTATLSLYSLLHVRSRWKVAANATLLAGGTAMAAFARTDTGPFILALSGAVVIACAQQALRHWRRLLALLPAWALGVWSFYAGQGSRVTGSLLRLNDVAPEHLLAHNVAQLPAMFFGAYGYRFGLGWFDTAMPAMTVLGASAVAVGLLALGLRRLPWPKLVGCSLIGLVHVVLPLYMLGKDSAFLGEHVQPRYFLPLIPCVFVLALLGRRSGIAMVLTLRQTIAAQVLLVLAHAFALLFVARRYLNGTEAAASYWLDRPSRWWWPGAAAPTTWYLAGVAASVVLSFALHLVRRDPARTGGATEASAVSAA